MKVKAKANFKRQDGSEVKEGDVIEADRAELKFLLDSGKVTKDLSWTPEDRGGQ